MKRIALFMFILVGFLLCSACASLPARTADESMLNFMPYLNQKVAGYIDMNQTATLDTQTYKNIVDKVCGPLPACGKDAAVMFGTYSVQARSLGDIFSVMLCDRAGTIKILEDFSCNEHKVEILSFQSDTKVQCIFEEKWKEKVVVDCPRIK
jgi:hypothetical protein